MAMENASIKVNKDVSIQFGMTTSQLLTLLSPTTLLFSINCMGDAIITFH